MILFEICGRNEDHPVYQAMTVANGNRQYNFLTSVVHVSLAVGHQALTDVVVKALNFHAIACLCPNAGEYRPVPVFVGIHTPPHHDEVPTLMSEFLSEVNQIWNEADPVVLAAYVLWRLNHIHPFVNGNGRTARAACYLVLCLKFKAWLPGTTILPELIRGRRDEYVAALIAVDNSLNAGTLDLGPLHSLITELIGQQLATVDA